MRSYGANLQILKVEIGSDMDSTDGAKSSHMHTATDENYNRGYEWWLMEQAKARNPDIKLAALAWGAPHWVGDDNYWSKDMIDYTIRWLKHAQNDHHLTIDYLGGRNERNVNRNYVAGKVTATIDRPIVSAMYDNLPYDNIGFIKCNQPWSGHYEITPSLWLSMEFNGQ
jgi:hypothetical protein